MAEAGKVGSGAKRLAMGAMVLLLGIGIAGVQPGWSSSPEPRPAETFRDCDVCPEMVVAPAGSFVMGSPDSDWDAWDGEQPQVQVTIPEPFAVGVYEVTNAEFVSFLNAVGRRGPDNEPWFASDKDNEASTIVSLGDNRYGARPGYENHPVIDVSWYGARAYAQWLREKTGKAYRLLTEAEWEYVARAGTATRYWWGDETGSNNANCRGCGSRWDGKEPAPVGSFRANPFGLYDVHGNAQEWVADCYQKDAYEKHEGYPAEVEAARATCQRGLRGGHWYGNPRTVRAANRGRGASNRPKNKGFRVTRSLDP